MNHESVYNFEFVPIQIFFKEENVSLKFLNSFEEKKTRFFFPLIIVKKVDLILAFLVCFFEKNARLLQ